MNPLSPLHIKNKHDRTFKSASHYWLSKAAFNIAPALITKLMREQGFRVKPYQLSDEQLNLMRQAHSYFLSFDDNAIKVFEWGTGPVILLAHGWAGRALQFDMLIRSLLQQGYKVVAFDHKGHGESSSHYSSFPEIVRSTELVAAHYGAALHGLIAHSIGANSILKVCETLASGLQVAVVAPVGDFLQMLETLRKQRGIDEGLFAQVIRQIEADSGLQLADLNQLNYSKLAHHDVLLVHDRYDRINKFSVSVEIHQNLHGSSLMETEKLGHSRILNDKYVIARLVSHITTHKALPNLAVSEGSDPLCRPSACAIS